MPLAEGAVAFAADKAMRAAELASPGSTTLAQLSVGSILGSKMEVMFTGVGRRNFSFTFNFIPKSEQEAKMVYNIVQTFKEHMLPVYQTSVDFGKTIGGFVANRNDRMHLLAVCASGGGIAALFLFSVDIPVWAVVATATGATALLSIPWTVLITVITEVSSQSRATGVGLLGVSNQTGAVGGAALGGYLLAAGGFPGVGYLCLGAVAFSVVVIVFFLREPDRSL